MEELLFVLYGLFWVVAALVVTVLIIYLIIKRMDERKNETFEKRDN